MQTLDQATERVTKEYTISVQEGLHFTTTAPLINIANSFSEESVMRKENKTANLKSIMDVLALEATYGSRVSIEFHGNGTQDVFYKTLEQAKLESADGKSPAGTPILTPYRP